MENGTRWRIFVSGKAYPLQTKLTDMPRYFNPYTDFGFKKLFGEEGNKDLLIDFLNQMLPSRHQIADLSFENEKSRLSYIGIKQITESAKKEGMEMGMEKGMEIGAEAQKLAIAKQMKTEGELLEKIQRYTGLSAEEIEKLA